VAHLAARLTGERHRLTELSAGDLAVRASFAVSYDTLPERPDGPGEISPRRLFRQLGIPGASELSSAAVAALTGRPAAQVAAVLETLVDAHLLESPAPDRFRLHDLLYEYAAELAGQDGSTGDRDAALGRLHRWYAEQAVMAGQALAPDRKHLVIMAVTAVPVVTVPPQAFCWFETELGNLSMTSQRAPPGRRAGPTGPPR
jgi:hypothetical protein